MTTQTYDDVWREAAGEIRRARRLHPFSDDEVRAELAAARGLPAWDPADSRVARIVALAVEGQAETDRGPNGRHETSRAGQLLGELSSCGLISAEQAEQLEDSSTRAMPAEAPWELAVWLAQQGVLPPATSKRFQEGLRLGDYLLLESIGEGGMGEVFRARDLRMDRDVAVKVLSLRAARLPRIIERFARETKALARLDHPHIVQAYAAGELAGTPYLVMQYVDGTDLARLVYRIGPLPARLALGYARQAAAGLEYAHQSRVVHRDVKPSNILVDSQGRVKISDLGLARLLPLDDRSPALPGSTHGGTPLGTYSYMAPEQAAGSHEVDHRSDIYGLGCTLFFLLVGRSPAEGDSDEAKARWHVEGPIPSLRDYRPELSEPCERMFRRMLAKSPGDRQASMAEVGEELEQCLELLGQGRSLSGVVEATSSAPRQPAVATAAARTVPTTIAADAARIPRRAIWRRPAWQVGVAMVVVLTAALPWSGLSGEFGGLLPATWRRSSTAAPGTFEPPARERFTNSLGMSLTSIPAGTFLMGGPPFEEGSRDLERPQRLVTLTKPFYIGSHEVTQRQFNLLMKPDELIPELEQPADQPPEVDRGNLPAVHVTWEQAVEFCRRLSALPAEKRAGRGYRLPTEAEWEYCCRAGTTTAFSTGDDLAPEQANFDARWKPPNTRYPSNPQLLEVGSFAPNPFGLYDMHGNAQEWCLDRFAEYFPGDVTDPLGAVEGDQRVVRGGGYSYEKVECRSANRRFKRPNETGQFNGFRVVCVVQTEAGVNEQL
ncbi:MAG: SUMF1/EgtB/PvdO family nonheme iron enzyme [Pirellulaceae bacterium]|nr:SUMF1/EgtB/PvdO family nonheme iron enzyme [Pirellulaceae bacterium]